ncbi:hypothetical protein LOTGIDRAFT_175327 [Lottia gigantea]|uniref:Uncharacterized protein n=1 Tax=Lottia gigantea TaxID=225164 RepID=V4ADG5_LOTGI|nr:hypothetical protein LOTGIDRAFT_175327 [Lottia gigantea]ESO94887.1 hypothetical protein LOTGIDRAFT_175327 [Lottia gigantea]
MAAVDKCPAPKKRAIEPEVRASLSSESEDYSPPNESDWDESSSPSHVSVSCCSSEESDVFPQYLKLLTKLSDFVNREKGISPQHLVGERTNFGMKLLEEQEVVTVRGDGEFDFLQGNGVIRACDALANCCQNAALERPELLTSTSLRKYMATITQTFTSSESECGTIYN